MNRRSFLAGCGASSVMAVDSGYALASWAGATVVADFPFDADDMLGLVNSSDTARKTHIVVDELDGKPCAEFAVDESFLLNLQHKPHPFVFPDFKPANKNIGTSKWIAWRIDVRTIGFRNPPVFAMTGACQINQGIPMSLGGWQYLADFSKPLGELALPCHVGKDAVELFPYFSFDESDLNGKVRFRNYRLETYDRADNAALAVRKNLYPPVRRQALQRRRVK